MNAVDPLPVAKTQAPERVGLLAALAATVPKRIAPTLDIEAETSRRLILGLLLISAILQLFLFKSGLCAISWDESERTLIAHSLAWSTLFDASFWPPLTKILMGLPLKLHGDLFLVPRLEAGVMGLACLGALAFLTTRLFDNRLAAVVSVTLGLVLPQRLILSAVPLSDIYGYTVLLAAAGFAAGWLKTCRMGDLNAASVLLALACAIRLEVWFIAAFWGLHLAYVCLIERKLSLFLLVLNGIILSGFPLFWLIHTYVQTGSLDLFLIVRQQFIDFYGQDFVTAVRNNVLCRLAKDIVVSPALALGAAGLLYWMWDRRDIRVWSLVFFGPLLVEAADMLATYSVPIGEGLRSDGIWALLLLPFSATALLVMVERLTQGGFARRAFTLILLYALVAPLALYTHIQLDQYEALNDRITRFDIPAGRAMRTLLEDGKHKALLDATDGLDYLNMLVLSNVPDQFVLNVDADPVQTALYANAPIEALRRRGTAIVDEYRTDKFWTDDGPDIDKLRARGISFILADNSDYIRALEAHPDRVKPMARYGPWALFSLAD